MNPEFREGDAFPGYQGDHVLNLPGHLRVWRLGFVLARHLGFRRAFALFVLTEVTLAIFIRDSLSMNILMLIYSIDAIKEWQATGH